MYARHGNMMPIDVGNGVYASEEGRRELIHWAL